jgi:2TM domain-containing protein
VSTTIPTRLAPELSDEPTTAAGRAEAELRDAAVVSLKRKRKFVQDAFGYVTVNGVLWLIWALTDRSTGGGMPWPAWISAIWGFLLAIDAWRAFGRWPASLHRPITEADIEREMNIQREN